MNVSFTAKDEGVSPYNGDMSRILDKTILLLFGMPVLLLLSFSGVHVVALLLSIAVTSLYEVVRGRMRMVVLLVFLILAVFVPACIVFLPVIVYDCLREAEKRHLFFVIWVIPLVVGVFAEPLLASAYISLLIACACIFSVRTTRMERERTDHRALRDELRGMSLSLESKNRDLQAAQDYEVRLATLNERGRIARDIHDNVGHLLTRAIMQIEALQVVHASDKAVSGELVQVGFTVHEAMDTVRVSVHDLHDDALDVHSQLEQALAECGIARTYLEYEATDLPPDVGYCFLAVVREALSNTVHHSDASSVKIEIREYPGLYQLVVQDDGSEKSVSSKSGIGLSTMEDRARALGGVFRTGYEQGFRVFVSIPRHIRQDTDREEHDVH